MQSTGVQIARMRTVQCTILRGDDHFFDSVLGSRMRGCYKPAFFVFSFPALALCLWVEWPIIYGSTAAES
jgi:hypothetical protein